MEDNMEITLSFDFHCLLRDFKKNIWIIVLAALIAVMGVYVASHSVYTPVYTSSATMVVRAKVGTSGAYTSLSASSEMAKIYTEVFKQPSVEELAAAHLGVEAFNGSISAAVLGETNLLKLSVTADDPETAFRYLCAVLEIYPNISTAVFSNAVVDVIQDPQMPTAPSNAISNQRQSIIVLLAAGLQCCLIIALSGLRSTVKNEKGFTASIDGKLLGTVTHEAPHLSLKERMLRKKRALLINDGYSSLKLTEDYKKIATRLEWIQKTTQDKIFTITSVGENEGKSTSASNIAIALAGRGYRVLILDLDIRKPSIFKIFEYRRILSPDLVGLFSKEIAITPDFLESCRYKKSNLFLLMNKKRRTVNSEWISSTPVCQWIHALADEMDFVIVDTAPLAVSADAVSLANVVDQTILVVRTDRSKITEINDAAATIKSSGGAFAGCILNDVYKPFTFFEQIGTDPGGYYKYYYGSYKRHGGYERRMLSETKKEDSRVLSDSNEKNGQI